MSFSEWKTYKLGDFCEPIRNGYTPKSSEDLAYIGLEHIEQQTLRLLNVGQSSDVKSNKFKFESGDILFGKLRPYFRKVYRPKFSGICSTDISVFRAKKNFDTGYLFYLLATKDFIYYSNAVSSGTRMPRADWNLLKNSEWSVPNLKTQQRIASILSSLDDAIELNQQINKTLGDMAKAIFKEWFVDFNFPSTSSGQRPNATGKFQETEIGKIPVGWKVGKLGDVAEINPKQSLKKGSIGKYIEMKDLSEDSSIIKNFREREFSSGSKFQNGDTVLARITPCLENGKTGLVSILEENEIGWGSTEFIVLRGKGNVGSNFIYCLSRFEPFRNHAVKSMLGSSGRQRVVESMLIEFNLAIPPNELLINFEKLVTPFFNQINNNEKENQSLTKLRDTLLPKLMKGEININL